MRKFSMFCRFIMIRPEVHTFLWQLIRAHLWSHHRLETWVYTALTQRPISTLGNRAKPQGAKQSERIWCHDGSLPDHGERINGAQPCECQRKPPACSPLHSWPDVPSSVFETLGSPLWRLLFGIWIVAIDTVFIDTVFVTTDDPQRYAWAIPGLLTDSLAVCEKVLLLVESKEIANVHAPVVTKTWVIVCTFYMLITVQCSICVKREKSLKYKRHVTIFKYCCGFSKGLTQFKAAMCNFKPWRAVSKTKLNDQHYCIPQNSNCSETGSYYKKKLSSGFPSDDLRLLCLDSDSQRFLKATCRPPADWSSSCSIR